MPSMRDDLPGTDEEAFSIDQTLPPLGELDMSDIEALHLFDDRKVKSHDSDEEQTGQEPDHEISELMQPVGADDTDAAAVDWDAELEVNTSAAAEDNQRAIAAFALRKEEYEQKKSRDQTTLTEDVAFTAAEAAEKSRLQEFARSQMDVEVSLGPTSPPTIYSE
jgi:hypothetical protein